MANETTLALVTSMIDPIREAALWYATHNFVMSQLITAFTDRQGFAARTASGYTESAAPATLAETDDLTPTQFVRAALETLTPGEIGHQHIITDRRIETDPENVWADAARDTGYIMGKKLETDLLGLFSSLTGGIYGSASSRMSLDRLYAARARLQKAGIPGPYVTVLDVYQYLDIFQDMTNMDKPAPLSIRDLMQRAYTVTQISDFFVVVSSLVPRTAVQNEVQSVAISGTPTGGTYTLKFAEQETAAIAYNAAASAVQTALRALPNIGATGVAVTGSGPYAVTFQGTLAGENVPTLELGNNSLTGGTAPTVGVTVTTPGSNYALGAMFSRDALAVDLRRPLRLEPERDASQRWTELNATMVYAKGGWRPERGVILKSDASTPLDA